MNAKAKNGLKAQVTERQAQRLNDKISKLLAAFSEDDIDGYTAFARDIEN